MLHLSLRTLREGGCLGIGFQRCKLMGDCGIRAQGLPLRRFHQDVRHGHRDPIGHHHSLRQTQEIAQYLILQTFRHHDRDIAAWGQTREMVLAAGIGPCDVRRAFGFGYQYGGLIHRRTLVQDPAPQGACAGFRGGEEIAFAIRQAVLHQIGDR